MKIKIDKNVKTFMVNKMALFIHCFVKKDDSIHKPEYLIAGMKALTR